MELHWEPKGDECRGDGVGTSSRRIWNRNDCRVARHRGRNNCVLGIQISFLLWSSIPAASTLSV